MRFKKRLLYSIIFSAAATLGSLFIPLVPCRTAPYIPNPTYQWSLCTLNPDVFNSLNSIKEWWGYTSTLTDAYMVTAIIAFVAAMIFLHYTARKKK